MNDKVIKGLNLLTKAGETLAEGAKLVADGLVDAQGEFPEMTEPKMAKATAKTEKAIAAAKEVVKTVANAKAATPAPAAKSAPTAAPAAKSAPAKGKTTQAELDAMTYNDLKAFASKNGVPAVGARPALTQAILTALNNGTAAAPAAPAKATPAPAAKSTAAPAKTAAKPAAKAAPVQEEEDVDDDGVEAKVLAETDGMSDDDLRTVLEDAGLSTKGKHEALIARIVQGVRDGNISMEDEESEDEEGGEGEDTEARAEALTQYEEDCRADYEEGKLTRKMMVDLLNKAEGKKGPRKEQTDEELLDAVIAFGVTFIDDDGVRHDEGEPYNLGGVGYCCGQALTEGEDGVLHCETCGNDYESGEEE